jgi:hypothetical protein
MAVAKALVNYQALLFDVEWRLDSVFEEKKTLKVAISVEENNLGRCHNTRKKVQHKIYQKVTSEMNLLHTKFDKKKHKRNDLSVFFYSCYVVVYCILF